MYPKATYKLKIFLFLMVISSSTLQAETVRVGPDGRLITESDTKKKGIDGKLEDRYTSGADLLYKSKTIESSFSLGNDLLKKCSESNSNADACLIKYKDSNLEFSGKVIESKKGIIVIELENNELVDVIAKEVNYYANGANVKFFGKIKSIGYGKYLHHSVIDAVFQ